MPSTLHILFHNFQHVCGAVWGIHKSFDRASRENQDQSLGHVSAGVEKLRLVFAFFTFCRTASFVSCSTLMCLFAWILLMWLFQGDQRTRRSIAAQTDDEAPWLCCVSCAAWCSWPMHDDRPEWTTRCNTGGCRNGSQSRWNWCNWESVRALFLNCGSYILWILRLYQVLCDAKSLWSQCGLHLYGWAVLSLKRTVRPPRSSHRSSLNEPDCCHWCGCDQSFSVIIANTTRLPLVPPTCHSKVLPLIKWCRRGIDPDERSCWLLVSETKIIFSGKMRWRHNRRRIMRKVSCHRKKGEHSTFVRQWEKASWVTYSANLQQTLLSHFHLQLKEGGLFKGLGGELMRRAGKSSNNRFVDIPFLKRRRQQCEVRGGGSCVNWRSPVHLWYPFAFQLVRWSRSYHWPTHRFIQIQW